MQHLEALAAGAGHVEMHDELIHLLLQQRQIPAATAHPLDLILRQPALAQPVAIRRREILHHHLGCLPRGFIERAESPLHAIRVVTAGVEPQHHRRARVEELAGHHNLVPAARRRCPGTRHAVASRQHQQTQQHQRTDPSNRSRNPSLHIVTSKLQRRRSSSPPTNACRLSGCKPRPLNCRRPHSSP